MQKDISTFTIVANPPFIFHFPIKISERSEILKINQFIAKVLRVPLFDSLKYMQIGNKQKPVKLQQM